MRVLIIEDEERMRSITKTYLEREGWEIVEAPDGEGLSKCGRGFLTIFSLTM